MKFILGKKIEMTQRFREDGRVVPVTVVQAGPCVVTQVKSKEKDGYVAIQLGYGQRRRLSKPLAGHLKGLDPLRYLREFRLMEPSPLKKGDEIRVDVFQPGDIVSVTGQSKGKGFQGVVRRHGFAGSPASHGHKDQLRMPGSIGATAPQRVLKGKRMAGHMGDERVTVKNLEVMEVDLKHHLLFIQGAVPGARGGLLSVAAPGVVSGEPAVPSPQKDEPKVVASVAKK